MEPIRILRIYHNIQLNAAGQVEKLVRIDFNIGNDGPFNKSFPESSFDQAAAFAEISKFAGELEKLRTTTNPSGQGA